MSLEVFKFSFSINLKLNVLFYATSDFHFLSFAIISCDLCWASYIIYLQNELI